MPGESRSMIPAGQDSVAEQSLLHFTWKSGFSQ